MFEKIMPRMFVYAYDPERIEEMLDRKSREGWQCYEVGLFYCFHRGEPDEYEYRVQATKKKEMERLQYIKGLRELGIEHVALTEAVFYILLSLDAPLHGYGDMTDLPHRGFTAFSTLLDRYHPQYMLHGHIHLNYGASIPREHTYGTTRIVNSCSFSMYGSSVCSDAAGIYLLYSSSPSAR